MGTHVTYSVGLPGSPRRSSLMPTTHTPSSQKHASCVNPLSRLRRSSEGEDTRIVLSVHDQLLFNIPKTHVVEVYEEVILPIMTRTIPELKDFSFRISTE